MSDEPGPSVRTRAQSAGSTAVPGRRGRSGETGPGRRGEHEPIRVCHFLNSLGDGGVQNLLLHISRLEDGDDVETSICYLRTLETSLASEFRDAGVRTTHVGRDAPVDPRAALTLARYVEERDVDVVHAHLPLQQVLARIACRLTDAAVVSTHHNLGDNTHPAVVSAEKVTRPLDDVTVAVSDAVRRRYVGRWSIESDDQWRIVHNGIDVEGFHERVASRGVGDEPGVVFVHVGRYIPGKAQTDLLHAMARVVEQRPDAHLYLVGWGDLEETLTSTASRLGLADNVTVTGYQSDVEEYYARADAFVTSSLSEGFPITFIEAMASELPIVTTAFDGASDIVVDGETGVVVPRRDRSALAEAMIRVQSERERERMGANGYERARERFDVSRTNAAYDRIYRACDRA